MHVVNFGHKCKRCYKSTNVHLVSLAFSGVVSIMIHGMNRQMSKRLMCTSRRVRQWGAAGRRRMRVRSRDFLQVDASCNLCNPISGSRVALSRKLADGHAYEYLN